MRALSATSVVAPLLLLFGWSLFTLSCAFTPLQSGIRPSTLQRNGWIQKYNGEWEWKEDNPYKYYYGDEDDDDDEEPVVTTTTVAPSEPSSGVATIPFSIQASATPQLPSQSYKPKQSLGQNYLKDPNTVAKIVRAFHVDGSHHSNNLSTTGIVELGPGAGALTDKLVEVYGVHALTCIEIDPRSVQLLQTKHPMLDVRLEDVLQVDYSQLALSATADASKEGSISSDLPQPLVVIGNLPYYITSQILFALADASHVNAVGSATVTMQWEVAKRMVAHPNCKEYGILSVVFQLYARVKLHFKIPPTVFYPKPKVDSALVGLQFVGSNELKRRLNGVSPMDLRRVITTSFQQRRKTLRNSLKKLVVETGHDPNTIWNAIPSNNNNNNNGNNGEALLPPDWASLRPEQLHPEQFVQVTRHLFGESQETSLPVKCWRKLKHGRNADDEH